VGVVVVVVPVHHELDDDLPVEQSEAGEDERGGNPGAFR
jgi:hypothetical protein